jgi:hypothetical protein
MKKIQSKITLTYVILTFIVIAAMGGLFSAKMESYFNDRRIVELHARADLMASLMRQESMATPEETCTHG